MKVIETRFRPLGRPPKVGEWARWNSERGYFIAVGAGVEPSASEACSREEVEVEVADPVPEFVEVAFDVAEGAFSFAISDAFVHRAKLELAASYRAHVAERAKAVKDRMTWGVDPARSPVHVLGELTDSVAGIIAEEFLK